jgi:hypothetical protein
MLLRETGYETLEGLEAALIEVAAEADAAIHAALGTGATGATDQFTGDAS